MAYRPLVTVQSPGLKKTSTLTLPAVFTAPIRSDVVVDVHTRMNKNHRQPHAVSALAGAQTSAQSWGTGRAVSRIPRVPGGGTHRSGQGAFGNMCRGGRMFSPTKVWRRWHVRISTGQRRYATVSALAGSSVYPLVLARGHRVERLPEVPLVVADAEIDGISKTKDAVKLLQSLGAYDDIERVEATKHVRAGKGKARGKRYAQKKGPLIVHNKEAEGSRHVATIVSSFRNIPGVELAHVSRLNLLQLAPGGRVGRFIIWTESAFKQLDQVFGTYKAGSKQKTGYKPPRSIMTNADLGRIINSSEIQSAIRPKKAQPRRAPLKRNPLKNVQALHKLNPAAYQQRRLALNASKPKSGKVEKPKAVRTKELAKQKARRAQLKKFSKVLHTPAVAPLRSELEKGAQL
jgi:large subunit ribosomal protein L4e